MTDPNHPQNKLPYADTIRGLIILDHSTQLAALRTHKLDLISVNWDKVAGLKQSNPELLFKLRTNGANVIFMRTDIAPFNDVRVRQALAMGVDRQTIIDEYFKGNAIADAWPDEPGNAGYTPITQMPANVKQLYEYHPDLARQLLAEAGYPNGLQV